MGGVEEGGVRMTARGRDGRSGHSLRGGKFSGGTVGKDDDFGIR